MIIVILLVCLLPTATSLANVITFSKALFIPGPYFSVMNFTYDVSILQDYFDIGIQYSLTQVALL